MSGERASVVIISPNLPAHDSSAGDLRLLGICRALAKRFDVVILSMGRRRGGQDDGYTRMLEGLGIQVVMPEFSLRDVFRGRQLHAVILEFYHVAEDYLPAVRILRPSCPVLVDSVDVHFHRERLKYDLTRDPADLERARETRRREIRVYRQADAVIAITDEDAAILKEADPSIHCEIIPNMHEIVTTDRRAKRRNTLVFVGNFHHQPNGDAVRYFCEDVLPLIHRRRADVRLRVIGREIPESLKTFAGSHVELVGFVPSVTPYLESAGVSIAPLRFGAGMKGKIGEAMAHGVPVVTTSVGAQGFGLTPGKDVLIGDTAAEFAESVLRLLQEDELYASISAESREFIRRRFTPEKVAEAVYGVMEGLKGRRVKPVWALVGLKFLARYVLRNLRRMWKS